MSKAWMYFLVRIDEGVTETEEDQGHVAAPERLVHHVASSVTFLDDGIQWEGLVPHTLSYI